MFTLNDDQSIYVTRGDVAFFSVTAEDNGEAYRFQAGDVVRVKVCEKKNCENVVLQKDIPVAVEADAVAVTLSEEETKIGDVISKPVDYWYEIELQSAIGVQTIVGYDESGPKVFRVYPEGG